MKRFTLRLTTPLHTTLPTSQLVHLPSSQLRTSKAEKMSPIELSQNANIHHLQTNITSPTANSNIHHLPNTTNTTPPLTHLDLTTQYPSPTSVSPLATHPLPANSSPQSLAYTPITTTSENPLHTAQTLFSSHQYDQALLNISSTHFTDLPAVRDLFYNIIYTRYSSQHPDNKMNACTRYRLRKKYPLPPTIAPSETTLYAMPLSTRSLLLQCFAADPYPCAEKKKYLSQVTDLTYTKINYWFKNMRVNRRRKMKAAC